MTATILIVDDDAAMLHAMTAVLQAAGFGVITATDGLEARHSFQGNAIALVVSDTDLPSMDGFGLLAAIRETREGTLTPFIFLSAAGTRKDILAGLEAGADAYLAKPVTSEEFLGVVRSRLKRFAEMKEGPG